VGQWEAFGRGKTAGRSAAVDETWVVEIQSNIAHLNPFFTSGRILFILVFPGLLFETARL